MNDIVTRLNRILSGADERGLDETECLALRDAATEIERLRNDVDWHQSQDGLSQIFIEKLRAERDEARRRVCENAIQHGRVYRRVGRDTVRCETPQQVAEMMGWDCYKENKENTND